MFDAGVTNISADGSKLQLFIIQGGTVVFDTKLGDNKINARFFEVAVCQSICAEKFRSAHLEPDGINCVVDNTGLIGFTVSWDDGYCITVNCRFFGKIHVFSPTGNKISRKSDLCKS